MQARHKTWLALGSLFFGLSVVPVAHAQVDSLTTTVNLSAVINETLTVLASPATVTFTLIADSTANGSTPITITTTWVLNQTRTSVTLYAYFTDAANALTEPLGINIPAANVRGSVNSGAFTSFSGAGPFSSGGSLTVFTEAISALNAADTRSDTLALQIDTTGLTLASGVYTGFLILQAQAI